MTESPLTLGVDALCELASEVSYQPEIRERENVQRDLAGYLRHTERGHRDHQLKQIAAAYIEANHAGIDDDYNRQGHWLGEAKRLALAAVALDMAVALQDSKSATQFDRDVDQALAVANSSDEPVVLKLVTV